MRYSFGLRSAVKVFDMAAAADLVDLDEIVSFTAEWLAAWTGVGKVRKALPFVDENSWSPMETEMRLLWMIDLALPRPLSNHPVFDMDGRHIGTPDLIDVEAGVVGEYDGSLHLSGRQRERDLVREAAFRAVGLEYVVMVANDRTNPGRYLQRAREAHDRARRTAMRKRLWTIEPPEWWTPTTTVAQRRGLSTEQKTRFLRLRAAA